MRTYERGVEGETLACGTGAVAAALALDAWKLGQLPLALLTRSGRRLEVQAKRAPGAKYEDVWLGGEARLVFRGVLT
jgi:diaminopimelate epimerase